MDITCTIREEMSTLVVRHTQRRNLLNIIELIHQQMHIYSFNDLKFTLKHLKRYEIFRSYDHPQGAYIVPC